VAFSNTQVIFKAFQKSIKFYKAFWDHPLLQIRFLKVYDLIYLSWIKTYCCWGHTTCNCTSFHLFFWLCITTSACKIYLQESYANDRFMFLIIKQQLPIYL